MSRESVTEEISEWAERCRLWASVAQTREQRVMLHSLEMVLSQAAVDAERHLDGGGFSGSPTPTHS
jgi:hypothetical protein